MFNVGESSVDVGTEAGSIAESLTRIVQQCPEDVRARALSLMKADNCAQFVMHVNDRLKAFLDSKKLHKNDDRSIFEKRKSALEVGVAVPHPHSNFNCCHCQALPPSLSHLSNFSDEEDVFSSGEKKKENDDDSSAFSDDRERSFSTTDSESPPSNLLIPPGKPDDDDSFMSDGNELKQFQKVPGSDQYHEQSPETQSFSVDNIVVNDDDELFSADEMKENSSDTDMSEELRCLRFSDMSRCFDDGDDS